jgi:hypothetical protein
LVAELKLAAMKSDASTLTILLDAAANRNP